MELIQSLEPYSRLFLALLSIKVIVQNYLDLRQRKSLIKNIKKVPNYFSSIISIEEHQKATNYNLEKLSFGKFVRSFKLIILMLWTFGGGLDYLIYLTTDNAHPVAEISMFFMSYILIETIISLPISLYSTFKIEEKYGFNKTTFKIFFTDLLKSLMLTVLIALPLFLGIIKLLEMMGEYWWIYSWATFICFQILLLFIYPKFLAPLFNKFSPLEDEKLNNQIQELLEKVQFNAKEIFKMDASKRSTHGNAYFTGFGKNKRIVFFDTILTQMNNSEILAILAHELGHFKKKHILKSIIIAFFTTFIFFYLLSIAIKDSAFLIGHGLHSSSTAASIILFMMIFPIYSFLLTPLGNIFSRRNEFEADNFACTYTSAEDLKSALVKLYKFNYGALTPDELYSSFYDSHPPAMIRIKKLDENNKKIL